MAKLMSNDFKRDVIARCEAKPCKWSLSILAEVIDEHLSRLSSILNLESGIRQGIGGDLAIKLSIALGETPGYWMSKHNAERLRLTEDQTTIRELKEIRERAANWKPGAHCKPTSKAYRAGYAAGYEDGKNYVTFAAAEQP